MRTLQGTGEGTYRALCHLCPHGVTCRTLWHQYPTYWGCCWDRARVVHGGQRRHGDTGGQEGTPPERYLVIHEGHER